MQTVELGLPLPLAAIANSRTMISVWNLADLIVYQMETCVPDLTLVLAGDPDSISTPEILRAIGRGLGKPARLVWFPIGALRFVGRLSGRKHQLERLVGSLAIEVGSSQFEFAWQAPLSTLGGVELTAHLWAKVNRHPAG